MCPSTTQEKRRERIFIKERSNQDPAFLDPFWGNEKSFFPSFFFLIKIMEVKKKRKSGQMILHQMIDCTRKTVGYGKKKIKQK